MLLGVPLDRSHNRGAIPAATPHAQDVALIGATCLAQTAADLLRDPALVEAAWQEFRAAG